jgi:large subunit ribosomal protein L31
MKKDIHPEYKEALVTCGCGNSFKTRSTRDKIAVEVCANCHPFYTGKQKFVDTAGMVEKFQRKWAGEAAAKAKAATEKVTKKPVPLPRSLQRTRAQQTIAATLGAPKQAAAPPAPKPDAPKPAAPAPAPAVPPAKNA